MLSTACQIGAFGVPTNTQLEGIKKYQRFAKFGQCKHATLIYEDISSQYDALVATRGKLPFGAEVMSNIFVT